jgi:hypothetical protein
MMAQTFMNDDEFAKYKKAWNQANKSFSDGYEDDNDNLMYGGLDDIEDVGDQLEDPVRDYFEDDYDAEFNKYSERTGEFDNEPGQTAEAAAQALKDFREKKMNDPEFQKKLKANKEKYST